MNQIGQPMSIDADISHVSLRRTQATAVLAGVLAGVCGGLVLAHARIRNSRGPSATHELQRVARVAFHKVRQANALVQDSGTDYRTELAGAIASTLVDVAVLTCSAYARRHPH